MGVVRDAARAEDLKERLHFCLQPGSLVSGSHVRVWVPETTGSLPCVLSFKEIATRKIRKGRTNCQILVMNRISGKTPTIVY